MLKNHVLPALGELRVYEVTAPRLDDSLSWDELNWWALDILCGIDLRHGPGGAYLHDDSQVRDWLVELRGRRTR